MRYLSSMAISMSRTQQPVCAATAGTDVVVTSAGGWCTASFLTGHKPPLDSTENAKRFIFGFSKKKPGVSHCMVCHSVVLFIDAGINRHQNSLFLQCLWGF